MKQELITQILTTIVQLIITIVGGFLINYLMAKIWNEKFNRYHSLARMVVCSVEQTLGDGKGADKKEEAIQALRSLSKNKLSEDQIDRLIEASVHEMNRVIKGKEMEESL